MYGYVGLHGITVMYGCEKVTGITEAERNSIY